MARSRIKTVAKLFLLLGLPLLVLGAIFGGGMAFGTSHSDRVIALETSILGWEEEHAPKEGGGETGEQGESLAGTDEPGQAAPVGPGVDLGKTSAPVFVPVPLRGTIDDDADNTPENEGIVEGIVEGVVAETGESHDERLRAEIATRDGPVAIAPKIPAALQPAFALRRVVTVKLMVDRSIVEGRPDWFEYSQGLIEVASATYEAVFGIELRLQGLVSWQVGPEITEPELLLADLRSRPRDGADLLVAITNRPARDPAGDLRTGLAPSATRNGAFALIYARGQRHPHLRTLLHEIAHLFGAQDIADPAAEAYKRKSWMSDAPTGDDVIPWIDADNLRIVLERKSLPFSAGVTVPQKEGGDEL